MAEELIKEDPKLTKFEKTLYDSFGIEEPVLFFSPGEVFDKGILGVSEDHRHIIYGYWTLVEALAEDYRKEWESKEHKDCEGPLSLSCEPDFYNDAMEWLDYNTIRSLSYQDQECCPIIIYELTKEDTVRNGKD